MLLVSLRLALIHACLAALEAAWATPVWLLVYPAATDPWAVLAILLAGLLTWMLVLELLGRPEMPPAVHRAAALALMFAAAFVTVRLVAYQEYRLDDLRWLGRLAPDALGFRGGLPPVIALAALNVFLYQRAASATSREVSFFSVGVSFRLGLLILIASAGTTSYVRKLDLTPILWFYFATGLLAVAVARLSEKANEAQSAGRPLPRRRLAQLVAAIGVTVGATWLLAQVFTPAAIRRALGWLNPAWELIKPVLLGLLVLLARMLDPVLVRIEIWLAGLRRADVTPRVIPPAPQPDVTPEVSPFVARLWSIVADVGVVIAIILAILLFFAFLLFYLERVRGSKRRQEPEEEGVESVTWGSAALQRGLQAVRNAARLLRRFGVGRGLLAAVSVQNIYANLCRLARARGHPRLPAQPPDAYLGTLVRAFGGHEQELGRITDAYMRVHYGDHPVTWAELGRLREDYRLVREAGPPRIGDGGSPG